MEAAQARLSLHLSKCHIVGNHMSRLNYIMQPNWLTHSPDLKDKHLMEC